MTGSSATIASRLAAAASPCSAPDRNQTPPAPLHAQHDEDGEEDERGQRLGQPRLEAQEEHRHLVAHPGADEPPERPDGDQEPLDRRPPTLLAQVPEQAEQAGPRCARELPHRSPLRLRHRQQPRRRPQLRRVLLGRPELLEHPAAVRVVALVGERVRQVGLEVVGQVVHLVRPEVGQAPAHRCGVARDVHDVRGFQHAHRTPSVSSRRSIVPANSCQSLRWASSIARPCALMP